ncbi:hypothetical protein [Kineosporia sp. R_H_3]|uniref:hypothetical protein n=1 Tax=Kineosporia sp. R_H_3 TaxID=1961848 RepID=UPI00117B6676|nr:hypothetical protein [Kineosporia sp. R_H_3]
MAENRAIDAGRPAFLSGDPTAAPARQAPVPTSGSRRDLGGSHFLEQQRRLRIARGAKPAAKPVAKHCWIDEDPRWPGRWPALLLAWVRDENDASGGWAGRVAFVPGPQVELVVALVPATYLTAEA